MRRHEKVQICKLLPHQKVVQPPAFVAGSGVETVVPVGVACDLGVLPPPCICEASAYQQLTERVPLLLQHHKTYAALCKKVPLLNWRQVSQPVNCRSAATGNNYACMMPLSEKPSWTCCSQPAMCFINCKHSKAVIEAAELAYTMLDKQTLRCIVMNASACRSPTKIAVHCMDVYLCKPWRPQVLLGSMYINLLVRTIEVPSQHHRFLSSQLLKVLCKVDVPLMQSIV